MDLTKEKNKEYFISLFHEYLTREHRSDLVALSTRPEKSTRALIIHFSFLCEFNSIFSEMLLNQPEKTLKLLDEGLKRSLLSCNPENKNGTTCSNVHVRLTALPVIPEVHRIVVPCSADVGKFIAFRGTVSRVGPVQVVEGRRIYECSKCKFQFAVEASFENNFIHCYPKICRNPNTRCKFSNLKSATDDLFYAKNYQVIRLHEPYRCLSVGVMPRSINVCLEDDLLETVKPGDDVVINGVVARQWIPPKDRSPCNVSIWIKANSIENLSDLKSGLGSTHISKERSYEFESFWRSFDDFSSELTGRNILLKSICPAVCGMYLIKLSVALLLAGAPESTISLPNSHGDERSSSIQTASRGCPHILLVGDPGTAKSVLLRAATNLSNRAVLTTATGTTAAGLTATAIRDANGWTLDAGALVLADGGICAIDEFTALHGTHRSAVHEAMEQQTISLAKAGLVTRLNCRCSVLAAANPSPDSSENEFGMPTPLLSRFDLIWRLVDPIDSVKWDRKIANFVLGIDNNDTQRSDQIWSTDCLREYFTWIRQEFKPKLSKPAASLLQQYYVWRRRVLNDTDACSGSTLQGRTTLRLLESLVRLTKAHARLMARSEALFEDAIVAIALMDISLLSTGSGAAGIIDSALTYSPEAIVSADIPNDASDEFKHWANCVCKHLHGLRDVGGSPFYEQNADADTEMPGNSRTSSSSDKIQEHGFPDISSSFLSSRPLVSSTQLSPATSFSKEPSTPACESINPSNQDIGSCDMSFKQRICTKLSRFTSLGNVPQQLTAKPSINVPTVVIPHSFKADFLTDVQLTDEDFEIDLF